MCVQWGASSCASCASCASSSSSCVRRVCRACVVRARCQCPNDHGAPVLSLCVWLVCGRARRTAPRGHTLRARAGTPINTPAHVMAVRHRRGVARRAHRKVCVCARLRERYRARVCCPCVAQAPFVTRGAPHARWRHMWVVWAVLSPRCCVATVCGSAPDGRCESWGGRMCVRAHVSLACPSCECTVLCRPRGVAPTQLAVGAVAVCVRARVRVHASWGARRDRCGGRCMMCDGAHCYRVSGCATTRCWRYPACVVRSHSRAIGVCVCVCARVCVCGMSVLHNSHTHTHPLA